MTWLAPLFVFGLVVFVHELGHFLAAKFVGVYAPVFSFGWGPRLWGFKRGETDYRISWLPVGGFVAMATRDSEGGSGAIEGDSGVGSEGEAPSDGHTKGLNPIAYDANALRPFGPRPVPRERWIESKPLWAKVLVMSAGVIANVLLTFVVLTGTVKYYGIPHFPAVVDSVVAGMPAAAAGLTRGDSITAVNGAGVARWPDVVETIEANAGQQVRIDLIRGGSPMTVTVTPAPTDAVDPATGNAISVGKVGVLARQSTTREVVSLVGALGLGMETTGRMAGDVVRVVKGLFSGSVSVKQLGGPIRIAQVSVEAAKTGMQNLWGLLALLSINIAILNLIPLPLLDGGQIVLRVVESIRGAEFSMRTQEYIARAGVALILLLFVIVMFNDIKALAS